MTGSRIAGSRTIDALVLGACLLVSTAAVAGAKVTPPRGTHVPGAAQASQIVKYSGFGVRCVVIFVDDLAPKWAYVTGDRSAKMCGAGFKGFAIVHENEPQNVNTVGDAWNPAYQGTTARCPLPKVPASVAQTFGVCR